MRKFMTSTIRPIQITRSCTQWVLLVNALILVSGPTPSAAEEEANGDGLPQAVQSFTGPLSHKIDSQTGRFLYQVPIAVPPARQGAEPQLGLTYGSGSGN